MNSRSWKFFYTAMIIGTSVPLIFDYRISLGFLLGSLEALIHYKRLESFWNGVLNTKVSTKNTGVVHFLFTFAMMAGVLLVCAFLPDVFNIFACAVGMLLIKFVTYIDLLIPKKEETW